MLLEQTRHVVILMELAVCDLQALFDRFKYALGVPAVSRIFSALVEAVDIAHKADIIHRDLKPQNFLLVPVGPVVTVGPPLGAAAADASSSSDGGACHAGDADRIVATTSTPVEDLKFRLLTDDEAGPGCAEVTLWDSEQGREVVLRLAIKLTDFGLAQPLEESTTGAGVQSHLSVDGFAGTMKYMAPESIRPTEDGLQRVSKRVDVWALGMMLFQMLHEGRTPFDQYHRRGRVGVAVAIASKFVYKQVMKLEREKVFADEWRRLEAQRLELTDDKTGASSEDVVVSNDNAVLVSSWLRTEALFRMCERCLAFDPNSRVEAGDLSRWMAESGFMEPGGKAVVAQALPELLPFGGAELSTDVRLSEAAIAEIGETIGQVVFAGGVLGAGGIFVQDETIIVERGTKARKGTLRISETDSACGTELAGRSKRCTLIKIFAALGVLVGGLVSMAFFVISINTAGGGLSDTSIGVPEGFLPKPPLDSEPTTEIGVVGSDGGFENSEHSTPTPPSIPGPVVPAPPSPPTSGPAALAQAPTSPPKSSSDDEDDVSIGDLFAPVTLLKFARRVARDDMSEEEASSNREHPRPTGNKHRPTGKRPITGSIVRQVGRNLSQVAASRGHSSVSDGNAAPKHPKPEIPKSNSNSSKSLQEFMPQQDESSTGGASSVGAASALTSPQTLQEVDPSSVVQHRPEQESDNRQAKAKAMKQQELKTIRQAKAMKQQELQHKLEHDRLLSELLLDHKKEMHMHDENEKVKEANDLHQHDAHA